MNFLTPSRSVFELLSWPRGFVLDGMSLRLVEFLFD